MRVIASMLLIAACGVDDPPAQPSWQVDVMPVLAANCVRCHSYPTLGFAAPGVRFDSYDAVKVAALPTAIDGASTNATLISQRIRYNKFFPTLTVMPPTRELGDYEVAVLRNWAGLVDGSMRAPRGPGRADNRAPEVTVTEVSRAGTVVTFSYELRDADHDLVVGSLLGPRYAGVDLKNLVVGDLVTGRDTFSVDFAGIPAGSYPLTARVDDGADIDGPDAREDYLDIPVGMLVLP